MANVTRFTFTLTVAEGYSVDLAALSLDAYATANTGTRAFYAFSDRTGVNAENVLLSRNLTNGLATTLSNFETPAMGSLAGVHLSGGESVSFYIYVQTDQTGRTIRFDNLKITGSVSAIPEPAAAASLAGVGMLVIAITLRRRVRR